ncbi:hypothetical protein FXO37_09166 [Capsicum annuum]|nr:hypothetical protein FXO37_09166 [Capsicum annuum]
MLTKNQFKKFCNDSIFGVFMKKKNCVVQAQLGRCIMSLETTESSISDIVIRVKGTTLHFSLREFAVVTGLNCHSNKDDFGFDEDVPNKFIDQYFDGSRFIQKKKLFAAVTDKIWGNENDEDVIKFANLYFIHEFLLSSVDTVTISRLHFDLVESDRYRDYPWGLVAYEELAKSLNKKLKPTGKFYMPLGMPLAIQIWLYECCSAVPRTVASKVVFKNIEPTRKEISTIQIPKKVFHRGESHKEDYVDSDDDFQDSPPKHQLSINKKKYQGDSPNSPTKKNLKNQSKGVDQHTPKRTPPSRAVKMSSVKTLIFKAIQSKETVPSNRKDISVESPDMSFFIPEDEDDVLSKKVFEKFRDEVKDYEFVKPQLDEADKDTSLYDSTPMLHHDFDKSPEATLDKIDTSVHEARDVCDSTNIEAAAEIIENTSMAECEKPILDEQINSEVYTHEAIFGEGKSQPDLRDSQITIPDELLPSLNQYVNLERSIIVHPSANKEQTPQIDVCLYYLRKKSKYEPNSSYIYSTVDCNFTNIVRVVLAVHSIDDPTLNAGGKEYHLNEYISGFPMHAVVPWHTVDHMFILINIKSKHHWVLAVLSFNSRCI